MLTILLLILCFVIYYAVKYSVYYKEPLTEVIGRLLPELLLPSLSLLFLKTVFNILHLGDEVYQIVFFFLYLAFIVVFETDETSAMKDSPLTKNGVILLYDSSSRSTVNVQVVYSMLYHNHYYARLSDGKQLSPLVRFPKHSSHDPPIYVGHVLAVNQAKLMKSDPTLEFMMDSALPYLFILAFTVVEQTDSLYGADVVSDLTSYYLSIKRISSHLVKFDQSMRALLDREETRGAELSVMGDQMRERGNALFKKGLYKQAAACYESASRLKLYDDRIFSNQSLVCFHLEEFSKALMLAMYAIKLNPFNIKAYYRACQCLEETKEHFQLFVQKRACRIVCGPSPDMDKFSDREFTTLIPHEMTSFNGPGGGGGRARSQSVVKGTAADTSSSEKKPAQNDKKAKASEDKKTKVSEDKKAKASEDKKAKAPDEKKKKAEHGRDASKTSEKGGASNKENAAEEKKHDSHVVDKKKTEEEPVLAPGYSSSGRDFACVSVLKEGRKFYKEAKYDRALDFYRTAVDSGLVSHRPKNEQKRLSFILCLCLVETGSVQNCITAVASLKSLLPASPAAAAAADDDSDLPRAPIYYLLTMAYHRTWQYAKGTSFAALFNRWFPKDKHRLPLQLPAFVEPIMQTQAQYLEKWYAAKPWLKTDELVVVETCRYVNCDLLADTGHHKHIVHSADLYTGHVELSCEENCHIFYHPACWRVIKDQKASDDLFSLNKNKISDKDFLNSPCLTPDCTGSIESVRVFDENKSILQEFIKERSPSEAKPKKKKNKKKSQQNYQNNKSKNDSIAKDNSKSEVWNSENTSKGSQEVPEPIIKKAKGVSMPGSSLPLDELDFQSCNVKVIKREPLDAQDPSKKIKKEKKHKKQRALDVERLVPDITDSLSGEQNEYLAKIRRLNAQKEALEKSVDCGSDQEEEDDGEDSDDDDDGSDVLDPKFYSPLILQSDPDAVTAFFTDKLDISSKYSYSREVNIPTPAKVEVLISFLEDFILHEGPFKWNDREFDSYVKDNLPQESLDCISRFGGVKEFLNCSPKFVIMDDYVCSYEHVGYVQELVYADIVRDFPDFCISDQYQAKTYLDPSPVFQSSSESSLTSESAFSVPSSEAATEVLPKGTSDVAEDIRAIVKSSSAGNVEAEARTAKTSTSDTRKSSRSGSVGSIALTKRKDPSAANKLPQQPEGSQQSKQHRQPEEPQQPEQHQSEEPRPSKELQQPEEPQQSQQPRGSASSNERQAPIKKDSSTETESSGLDGGFQTLFNDETNHQKERQLEKQVVKLQRKLDEVLKERNSLKSEAGQLQRKFTDLSRKMGVEVATLKKQLADAEENVQSRYKMVDQAKAESLAELRQVNAEKKKLFEENKNLVTKVNALEVREDCLKDEKRNLEQELERANVSAARQTDQLTMLEASLTSASDRSKVAELGYIDLRSSMIRDMIDRTLEFYRAALSRLQELHCRASVVSVPSSTLLQQQTEALQRHCDLLVAEKHKLLSQSDRLRVLINNGRPLNDTMKNSLDSLPEDLMSVSLTDLLALTQDGTVLMSPRAAQYMTGAGAPAAVMGHQTPTIGSFNPAGRMITAREALMEGFGNELRFATPRSPVTRVGSDVVVTAPEVAAPQPVASAPSVPAQRLPEVTPSSERQISVGNLPTSISDHQLKALFGRFGDVEAAEVLPALRVAFITFRFKRDCLAVLNEVATAPLMFGSTVLEVRPVTPSVRDSPDQVLRHALSAQELPAAALAPTPYASPSLSQLHSASNGGTLGHDPIARLGHAPVAPLVAKAAVPNISVTNQLHMTAASPPVMSAAGVTATGVPAMNAVPAASVPVVPAAGVHAMAATNVSSSIVRGSYMRVSESAEQPALASAVKQAPMLAAKLALMSAIKQAPVSAVKQTPMSAVKQVLVSDVKQKPTTAIKQVPTPVVNKAAVTTNKTSMPPTSSISKAENSSPALAASSGNATVARSSARTPTQMSAGVQPRLPYSAIAPSPSHDHSQLSHFGVKPKVTAPMAATGTVSAFATNRANARPAIKASDMAGKKSHERLADICQAKFGPEYSRDAILDAIFEVRCGNNNRLSGLAEDVIIERVKQLVRPKRSKSNNLTPIAPWANAAPPAKPYVRNAKVKDLENDDCGVCISPMSSSEKIKSLDCGHFFHAKCINDWLNIKSECPFCRQHNVDKEEYPPLSSAAKH